MKKALIATALAAAFLAQARAQDPSPLCSELVWAAQVLAANPDIAEACQGVYERNGVFYAKAEIELTSIRGNRLSFRTVHRDGGLGERRSITVPSSWRAEIGGRSYRPAELTTGQRLSIFIPEDRFALTVGDGAFEDDEEFIAIEEAEVVPEGR